MGADLCALGNGIHQIMATGPGVPSNYTVNREIPWYFVGLRTWPGGEGANVKHQDLTHIFRGETCVSSCVGQSALGPLSGCTFTRFAPLQLQFQLSPKPCNDSRFLSTLSSPFALVSLCLCSFFSAAPLPLLAFPRLSPVGFAASARRGSRAASGGEAAMVARTCEDLEPLRVAIEKAREARGFRVSLVFFGFAWSPCESEGPAEWCLFSFLFSFFFCSAPFGVS